MRLDSGQYLHRADRRLGLGPTKYFLPILVGPRPNLHYITQYSGKLLWIATLLSGILCQSFAADDPCSGLLNIIDRPSIADSACVAPDKKVVLEAGYQYQHLSHSDGNLQNLPQSVVRLGLAGKNELVLNLPNYNRQNRFGHSGFSSSIIGIKHELAYNQNWIATVEALFTLPGGSNAFGSKGFGAAFSGIVSYSFNEKFNTAFMLGGSSATQSSLDGGRRYESINPDLVFTYAPGKKINLYLEIYGQSKTGPNERSGFNCDGGLVYLLFPNIAADLEYGQRISGNLGDFEHYVGAGISLMF